VKRLFSSTLIALALPAVGGTLTVSSSSTLVDSQGGLGDLRPRYNSVFLDSLASDGRVLAHFEVTSGYKSAFTWKAGAAVDLSPPGAWGGTAYRMNASGWIAGSYSTPIQENSTYAATHFYSWHDGVRVENPEFPNRVNSVQSIDDEGRIYGLVANSYGRSVPFTWQDGQFQLLIPADTPNVRSGEIVKISPSGRVIGTITQFDSTKRAFTWADGTFIDLTKPGSLPTTAVAINASGEFTGTLYTTLPGYYGEAQTAYRWKDGVTTLAPAQGVEPLGINDAGQVLGADRVWSGNVVTRILSGVPYLTSEIITESGQVVGKIGGGLSYYQTGIFSWKDGVFSTLPLLPTSHFCEILSVDATGRIFGNYITGYDYPNVPRAFTWKDGVITCLPSETSAGKIAYVTSTGRAVGTDNAGHPFTWQDGACTILTGPATHPEAWCAALAINAGGTIIGSYYVAETNTTHACVWRGSTVATELSPPDAVSSTASLLNDAGQIVGTYKDASGDQHAFFVETDGTLSTIAPPPARAIPTPKPTPSPTPAASPSPAVASGSSIVNRFGSRTPPRVTIIGPPSRKTQLSSIVLAGTVRDNGPVQTVAIRTGKGLWRQIPGQQRWHASVELLPGRNAFSIRATDRDGNQSAVKTVVIWRSSHQPGRPPGN
jgi:probable HAF family extracellular repeat protein